VSQEEGSDKSTRPVAGSAAPLARWARLPGFAPGLTAPFARPAGYPASAGLRYAALARLRCLRSTKSMIKGTPSMP
jgi:hypothetical protein